MKVLYISNVPSPYRVDFFNELGKYCDLTVAFEKKTSSERDSSWLNYNFENFKGIIMKGVSVGNSSAVCFEIKKIINQGNFDKIICTNFSSITGMIAIHYMRRKKIKYFLESDGGFAKNGKGIKEKIKKHFIKGAEGYLSTGENHDEYYLTYGANGDKIYRYPFTSVWEKDVLNCPTSDAEKERLKKELGIKEKNVVLAVGQFIKRKGFDLLIKASKKFSSDVGLYFVGGEPTDEYVNLVKTTGANNVHFVGFTLKDKLADYYRMADVFVLPTREDIWGLVVNEAMAHALPVVTTNRCGAGLSMIRDGENGYIVPVEDYETLGEKILLAFNSKGRFALSALNVAKEYTIEKMVDTHRRILEIN